MRFVVEVARRAETDPFGTCHLFVVAAVVIYLHPAVTAGPLWLRSKSTPKGAAVAPDVRRAATCPSAQRGPEARLLSRRGPRAAATGSSLRTFILHLDYRPKGRCAYPYRAGTTPRLMMCTVTGFPAPRGRPGTPGTRPRRSTLADQPRFWSGQGGQHRPGGRVRFEDQLGYTPAQNHLVGQQRGHPVRHSPSIDMRTALGEWDHSNE